MLTYSIDVDIRKSCDRLASVGDVAVAGSIASAISVTIATAVATAISCRGLLSSGKLGNGGQWIAAAELGSLRVQ